MRFTNRKSPYSAKWRYERERVIYGLCVNTKSRKHYCFNRDYFVLPVQFPPPVLEALIAAATSTIRGGFDGHGRFHIEIGPRDQCETYFIFDDGNPPKWSEKTRKYDKSIYETPPKPPKSKYPWMK